MATDTLQFEKQAVEMAEQELQQAQRDFNNQMGAFTTATETLIKQTVEYIRKRQFWLE